MSNLVCVWKVCVWKHPRRRVLEKRHHDASTQLLSRVTTLIEGGAGLHIPTQPAAHPALYHPSQGAGLHPQERKSLDDHHATTTSSGTTTPPQPSDTV